MPVSDIPPKRVLYALQMNGNNTLVVPPAWTAAIAAWDEELRASGKPETTRYLRTYHLRRLASEHPATCPWDITREQLITWLADAEWKPETRRGYRASLRSFYKWAHARGHLGADPSATLPTIKTPRALPRPAPNDVVDDALRTADLRTRLMVMILTHTGMRRGELAKLHTRDLERDLLGWSIRVIGKGGHERSIPIDDRLAATLRRLPAGYVFPGQIDGHLSAHYVGKLVSAALGEGWTAHTLRHRYATLAYSVERDLRAVQELLGHANVTTTQIYTFIPRDSVRRAAGGARLGLTA